MEAMGMTSRRLSSGPFGLFLTPYARAVIALADEIIPLVLPVKTNFTGTGLQNLTSETDAQLYDTLILGAHHDIGTSAAGDSGQQILLKVTHMDTGLAWNSAVPLDPGTPVSAFAGFGNQPMPVIALSEAFFLPAFSRLRHDWRNCFAGFTAVTGGAIHWLGVQLVNYIDGQRPHSIKLDTGEEIRIGRRLPWFQTSWLGTETVNTGVPSFALLAGYKYDSYTQPEDCDIEIHGVNCNFLNNASINSITNIKIKFSVVGNPEMWTFRQSALPSLVGDLTQARPFLPFASPWILKRGERIRISMLNNGNVSISQPCITFSGVRLCAF